ncbi:hypothetical protein BDK51DRAFT_25913 [Blyttiomyces helicus]|uniref:Uncharacterized protein n=1 Tax=Blyttiomyces helicus TaxID=388810 RepID=A0A4P9WID2_9FUNG|nr:hypothetical protein BDK51DRAFT_25913 [Blyttiomyces helicus]|eukprot:RKO90316.1 hypothetical protein BDK51DRAFT_25913 [Blyttiomyces helicus]
MATVSTATLTLIPRRFYSVAATWHPDLEQPTPLDEKKVAGLVKTKVAEPHLAYLAEFNTTTGIGVVFLGTLKEQKFPHRFLTMGPSPDGRPPQLTTNPLFLKNPTFLNFTHPLRVHLIPITSSQFHNNLRRSGALQIVPLDVRSVGTKTFVTKDVPPGMLTPAFTPESLNTFWKAHVDYNSARPGAPRGPKPGPSAAFGSSVGGGTVVTDPVAPWGWEGDHRRGIDIPLDVKDEAEVWRQEQDDEEEAVLELSMHIWPIGSEKDLVTADEEDSSEFDSELEEIQKLFSMVITC